MSDPEIGSALDDDVTPRDRGVVPFLARAGSHAAAGLLVVAMVTIVVNSLFRRFLGGGSHLVTELAGYTFMVLTFLGAAGALLLGHHVSVELLTGSMNRKIRLWVTDLALGVVGCVYLGLLLWAVTAAVFHDYQAGVVDDGVLRFPLWPILSIVPLGTLLLLFAAIYLVWKASLLARGGEG